MAKKFQFRLGQVLELRKQIEDLRVKELAQAKGRLLQIEETLKQHAETENLFLATYGDFEKTGEFNADQVMAYCEYKDWLVRREKEYRRQEKEWTAEVEKRRDRAVKASREKKLLANLKEKKMLAHSQEVLGEEQRFLDEVSSIAYVRRERANTMNADLVEKSGR
ncbi:MAG TPA: flagellar export protein FliJ [bacterium]|nr:flagellar export protein FliJ [bacterium]